LKKERYSLFEDGIAHSNRRKSTGIQKTKVVVILSHAGAVFSNHIRGRRQYINDMQLIRRRSPHESSSPLMMPDDSTPGLKTKYHILMETIQNNKWRVIFRNFFVVKYFMISTVNEG
jgi:hypothetical protein